jgi:hypothetical protein
LAISLKNPSSGSFLRLLVCDAAWVRWDRIGLGCLYSVIENVGI